jgi:hypothetical protein
MPLPGCNNIADQGRKASRSGRKVQESIGI